MPSHFDSTTKAYTFPGNDGTVQNRNINAAATTYATSTNTATWTTGVTQMVFTAKSATAAALQNDEFCLIAFDAPTEGVASSWLSDTGGAAVSVQYHMLAVGEPREFYFTDPVTRVDVLPLNDTMSVVIEAV